MSRQCLWTVHCTKYRSHCIASFSPGVRVFPGIADSADYTSQSEGDTHVHRRLTCQPTNRRSQEPDNDFHKEPPSVPLSYVRVSTRWCRLATVSVIIAQRLPLLKETATSVLTRVTLNFKAKFKLMHKVSTRNDLACTIGLMIIARGIASYVCVRMLWVDLEGASFNGWIINGLGCLQ